MAAVLAFGAAIAASVVGYHVSRDSTNQQTFFGDLDNPNRIEINAWINHIDPAKQTVSVTLEDVLAAGDLADDGGNFAADAVLTTNAVGNWRFPIKAGETLQSRDLQIIIVGQVSDYPIDRYDSDLEFHVTDAAGKELPIVVTVENTDAFFDVATSAGEAEDGGTVVDLLIRRSASTRVFAGSIMVLMLGLAVAAAIVAYYVLHNKRGLNLSACSLLAGMLFALIPLRNAVPGDPPIGSIIDFGSFFIAEATIAISLILCVLLGYRHQLKAEAQDAIRQGK